MEQNHHEPAPSPRAAAQTAHESDIDNATEVAPEAAPAQFVRWFREVAPYVHRFRGKTFVIGFGGELIREGHLNTLIQIGRASCRERVEMTGAARMRKEKWELA